MLLLPIIGPLVLAGFTLLVPSPVTRRWLVTLNGILHALATAYVVLWPQPQMFDGWLSLGPIGRVLLAFVSAQYLILTFYAPGYLAARAERPNRVFCAALVAIIGPMSLVMIAHHLGLMWVA